MMARQFLIDLANRVEEEMELTVELEERETCKDLIETVEKFEKASRKEKAARMKFAFQLNDRTEDVLDQSVYEEEVERRLSGRRHQTRRHLKIETTLGQLVEAATTLIAAAGVKARTEACITPTINSVKMNLF